MREMDCVGISYGKVGVTWWLYVVELNRRISMKLPNMTKPCSNCPFRKDSLKGWLGAERMSEIIASDRFVCHKKTDFQCAGHMLLNDLDNAFVRLAARLNETLNLKGREFVFDTKAECINHHSE